MVTRLSASLILSALIGLAPVSSALAVDGLLPVAVEIEAVADDGVLLLADGSSLCLAGIWLPAEIAGAGVSVSWRPFWQKTIRGGGFRYPVDARHGRDRYGCMIADIENEEGRSLTGTLLEAGWASVDPTTAPEDPALIDAMLAREDRARRARLGVWRENAILPKAADDLAGWTGTRQLVEGQVVRVYENKRYLYLNFGADWRTDFTTRLDRKMIETGGFEAMDYNGKKLRVRGVLVESRGPLIDITHLKQIEFLP